MRQRIQLSGASAGEAVRLFAQTIALQAVLKKDPSGDECLIQNLGSAVLETRFCINENALVCRVEDASGDRRLAGSVVHFAAQASTVWRQLSADLNRRTIAEAYDTRHGHTPKALQSSLDEGGRRHRISVSSKAAIREVTFDDHRQRIARLQGG